jgi:hypothetical protein
MHRREFLGASLAGAMAAIFLRLDELMAWWKQWLGTPKTAAATGRLTVSGFQEAMKKLYPKKSIYEVESSPMFAMRPKAW